MKDFTVIVIAKVFDKQGCIAYRTKSLNVTLKCKQILP